MPSWSARHPELAFSPIQEICINKHMYRNSVAITKIFEGLYNFFIHRFGYKIHFHVESNTSKLVACRFELFSERPRDLLYHNVNFRGVTSPL